MAASPRAAANLAKQPSAPAAPPEPDRHDGLERAASPDIAEADSPAQTVRTQALNVLRGLHADHMEKAGKAAPVWSEAADGVAQREGADTSPNLWPTSKTSELTLSSAPLVAGNEGAVTVGGSEQLQSLIESCCSRLWINDAGGGAAQGVLLDLGRWMPGCTIEIARAAGVLRVTLRGAEGDRLSDLAQGLDSLGDRLARKLGCQVVAAIEDKPR
jgi:hypothetical protein